MATNTTNYGFKKPDVSDFYDVADQNKNWDLADEALKNLDMPTFEDYTGSTAVPSATDAIDQIKSKGKLGTLLSNIKAAFKGACLIGHIVNNCVTDNAGLPLSAAQGKVLKDLYTQLYSDKADVSALNSYATKSELTASKNGYPGVKTIKSLSSAGQLTQAGSYHFEAITADVNKDAGTEIFSEYNMGDFYALLLGEDSNSNDGCNFGTLLIASPRINNGIWICTIWQKKMIHWYKIAKISTD